MLARDVFAIERTVLDSRSSELVWTIVYAPINGLPQDVGGGGGGGGRRGSGNPGELDIVKLT